MQQGHPIAYLSKGLGPRNSALSTYEKECLVVLLAIDKWKPYLQHKEFTIITDHKSLLHLGDQKLTTGIQHKAFLKLMGFQYKIMYKKGTDNSAADALSRKQPADADFQEAKIHAVSECKPKWLEIVVEGYTKDPETKQLLTKLSITGSNSKGYHLSDGVIKYKERVWLGNHKEAHNAILLALHDSGIGGHSGFKATYYKIKTLFAWLGMKQDIQTYVAACEVCQQEKSEHCKLPGTLQPLPVLDKAWEIISMDFIEGLPKSQSYNAILVGVDKFTKYGHFLPSVHPFTAQGVALTFMNNVYKLHDLPQVIISDRDKVFTSNFWKELFTLSETTLNMSSAYHLQTDGQTERLNQCLETYLHCMVQACPTKWSKWLALAEY